MSLDIDALLSELTLEEKASLTSGSSFWYTAPVDRLGIPRIMVSDGPHGLRAQPGEEVAALLEAVHEVHRRRGLARGEAGDGPVELAARRVTKPDGAEPDDAASPQHRLLAGDLVHEAAHRLRVVAPPLVGDGIEEGADVGVGGTGLGLCHGRSR